MNAANIDMSPLDRAVRALEDSENRLQQVLDHASALVFAKDVRGRYLFVNREFERIAHRAASDIIGHTDDEVFLPELASRFRHNDLRVLRERRAIEFEEALEFDGAMRTYLAAKFPLFDAVGMAYAVCGIATDITGRKRLEEALTSAALAVSQSEGEVLFRELCRYLATILGVECALIATPEPDSGEYMQVRAACVDGEILENFRYRLADTPCESVVGGQFQFYATGLRELFPADTEYSHFGFDSYAGHPLTDADGRALGLIAVASRRPLDNAAFFESVLRIFAVRVIAELERVAAEDSRRRLEARLRQAQKMEAIGQLTGGIAHDFNNLLTSILGYVTLAGEREAALGDVRLSGYLGQARRSCERARDLIQQMLMFSRGQRRPPRTVALAPLVEAALDSVRPAMPQRLKVTFDAAEPALAACLDPLQFEQVLLNLCMNARDAIGGAGHIVVYVRPMSASGQLCAGCRCSIDGRFVELCVEDSGHGMTPEIAERVFEPFFSTKADGKGTGMGLAMVHAIVHEHGGHVLLETEPGRGSRFRVLWPASGNESSAAQPQDSTPQATRVPPRLEGAVLIVDDEIAVGEFMRELLGTRGLDATFVTHPQAALELVAASPARFAAVITDQSMPRMTGVQLARALHEVRPGLPIILYSGYSDGLTAPDLQVAAIQTVLPKPVDPAALESALWSALSRR